MIFCSVTVRNPMRGPREGINIAESQPGAIRRSKKRRHRGKGEVAK
jgi:hypothetical protein